MEVVHRRLVRPASVFIVNDSGYERDFFLYISGCRILPLVSLALCYVGAPLLRLMVPEAWCMKQHSIENVIARFHRMVID